MTEEKTQALVPVGIEDMLPAAKVFYESGMFDAKNANVCAVKIYAGAQIGVSALDAMTEIHFIRTERGTTPFVGAGIIAAKIKGSGKYDYVIKEASDKRCVIRFSQWVKGTWKAMGPDVSFTIEEAKERNLANKHNWKTAPSDMLFARALTRGYKRYCRDVLGIVVHAWEEKEDFEAPPEKKDYKELASRIADSAIGSVEVSAGETESSISNAESPGIPGQTSNGDTGGTFSDEDWILPNEPAKPVHVLELMDIMKALGVWDDRAKYLKPLLQKDEFIDFRERKTSLSAEALEDIGKKIRAQLDRGKTDPF